jgi:hypothetical protein
VLPGASGKKLTARDDPAEWLTFYLAEKLHMTVADIEERMPADEFMGWLSYMNGLRAGGARGAARDMPRTLAGVRETLESLGVSEARRHGS